MSSEEAAATPTKEELIALLSNGKIEEFNRVRPEGKIDLRGAFLRLVDLRGANLIGADLWEADFVGTDLRRVDLTEVSLQGVNLIGADLREAILRGANLIGANLEETDLREVSLIGADLWKADLHEAKISAEKGISEEHRSLILQSYQKSWEKVPNDHLPPSHLAGVFYSPHPFYLGDSIYYFS